MEWIISRNSAGMLAALLSGILASAVAEPQRLHRTLPVLLPSHPGNIFLEGEEVVVPLPAGPTVGWRLHDYDDKEVAVVAPKEGRGRLGQLPAGFYRLKPTGETTGNWISIGVLAPLKAPTPRTSPVALDVAMAWFYPRDKMEAVANLCALAGVNWVRDRLNWTHMEPQRGQFAGTNQYDASALAQTSAGLQVLQVNHLSPPWANPKGKRFPLDLRDTYRFHREMAQRWRRQVPAFEPWNEADIKMFGGHTGSEMATLQKAAYLGLKAGNPEVIACLNVFAMHKPAQLEDLHDNEAWPYFDTFNLHHYEAFDRYPKLYADFRAVSAGKPLWVTECALPVKWAGDEKLKEPTDPDLRVQAERVAKTFALSIHEGSVATFYFLLPHYVEGPTQFGIVRPDLTPRPAFVALAAVGRFMADARPLGQLKGSGSQRAFLFRVKADGRNRELLVAWENQGESQLVLPVTRQAVYDHLGRPREASRELKLGSAPAFVLLPVGAGKKLALVAPPQAPPRLAGTPSPVVLQALWPEDQVDLDKSAYRISMEKVETIPLWIYNFRPRKVSGKLLVTAAPGWTVSLPGTVELLPDERKELTLTVDGREAKSKLVEKVRITGDFGRAGKPVLSLRVVN